MQNPKRLAALALLFLAAPLHAKVVTLELHASGGGAFLSGSFDFSSEGSNGRILGYDIRVSGGANPALTSFEYTPGNSRVTSLRTGVFGIDTPADAANRIRHLQIGRSSSRDFTSDEAIPITASQRITLGPVQALATQIFSGSAKAPEERELEVHAALPEPSTLALALSGGMLALALAGRRLRLV